MGYLKLVVLSLWLVFALDEAQAEKVTIFRSIVSLQVLCTSGGPGLLIEQLLEDYNEKPVHGMDLSTPTGVDIQMYITENKNNPSSTFLLHNKKANKTCIFWSSLDYLRTIETESLPAKTPEDKTDA
jgi:hypothetical protein|tara:strand:- start:210 stop:590 length:381 start_codon:yes stop_codon:yes gene_type:complete